MARQWTGRWAGGRARLGLDGKTVWVIEGMRREKRYSISLKHLGEPEGTDPKTGLLVAPKAVMAEWALFDRDPVAYTAGAEAKPGDVVRDVPALTMATYMAFLDAKQPPAVTKGHLADLSAGLGWWLKRIGGKDLRKLTVAEYRAHLKGATSQRKKILALRSFTHWLREEKGLAKAQDASTSLPVPQPETNREEGEAVAYPMAEFERLYSHIRAKGSMRGGREEVYPKEFKQGVVAELEHSEWRTVAEKYGLSVGTLGYWRNQALKGWPPDVREPTIADKLEAQAIRDILALRALCGMHYSEIARIARRTFPVVRLQGHGEIAGTVKFWHKDKHKKKPHVQALTQRAVEAVERLQTRGYVPDKKVIHRAMDAAAAKAKLHKMRPGQLRHSFVTWSRSYGRLVKPIEGMGVDRRVIARLIGHENEKTTAEHYDDTKVPELIVLPLRLENEEDPVASSQTVAA